MCVWQENELSRLRGLESTHHLEKGLLSTVNQKEVKRLKQQVAAEKKMKLEAFAKLDELRMATREALAGGDESGLHQLAVLFERRYEATSEQLQSVQADNDRLRAMLEEHGIEVPPPPPGTRSRMHVCVGTGKGVKSVRLTWGEAADERTDLNSTLNTTTTSIHEELRPSSAQQRPSSAQQPPPLPAYLYPGATRSMPTSAERYGERPRSGGSVTLAPIARPSTTMVLVGASFTGSLLGMLIPLFCVLTDGFATTARSELAVADNRLAGLAGARGPYRAAHHPVHHALNLSQVKAVARGGG